MQTFFEDLFNYQAHFNLKLIEQFELHEPNLPTRAIPLFSHVLNAHQIWNARILAQPILGVFDVHPLGAMRELAQRNHNNSLLIIAQDDFERSLTYTNSKGDTYTNTIRDILFHVVNHTTYHRGQLMSDFRQAGLEPLVSDYVFFRRT
jgi:uncharacterized damage-inducible protein DinB